LFTDTGIFFKHIDNTALDLPGPYNGVGLKLMLRSEGIHIQWPPKVWRQPVIFLLPSITTPCPIKFNNSQACPNYLI